MTKLSSEDIQTCITVSKAARVALRALCSELSRMKEVSFKDPETGRVLSGRQIVEMCEAMNGVNMAFLEEKYAAKKEAGPPPSLGTTVRTMRKYGEPRLSDAHTDDLQFTTRLMTLDNGLGEEAHDEGRAAAAAGLGVEHNPYDLHDDHEALAYLNWISGWDSAATDG